jgi:hypothetical protein
MSIGPKCWDFLWDLELVLELGILKSNGVIVQSFNL